MIGQLFAQPLNLFGCNRAGTVPPLTPLVREYVGDLLVGQCFVPGLHHRGAEFLSFDRDRTLQTFEDNHGGPARAASCKLRTGQWRILSRYAETVGLMTGLTIGRENLFAPIARRKFCLLLFTLGSGDFFHRLWLTSVRVKRLAAKVSRVTTKIGATEKHGQTVNCDQPN